MKNRIFLSLLLLVSPALSFGQTTLNFPKFFSAAELPDSGFAIVNPGSTAANVLFTLYAANGSVVSQSTTTSYPALLPGTQQAELGSQIFPTLGAGGWVQVTSSTTGLQGFWLNYNSALTYLDGAEAATTAVNETIPLVSGNTDVNIANPNSTATTVLIQLMASNGTQLATQVMETIPAYGVFHSDAFALFNLAIQTQTCYVRVISGSTNALAVTALVRNYLVPLEDGVVNGVDESSTATQLSFPHVISGSLGSSNYTTVLGVTNLSNAAQTVTVTFFSASGSSSTPVQIQLSGRGTLSETIQTLFSLPATGFENGWVQATGSGPITGFAAYADLIGGAFTVVPGEPDGSTNLVFAHLANLPPWQTGIALLNPGTTTANVKIYAMTPAGTLIGGPTTDPSTAVLTLAPDTKTSLGLSQMIPEAGVQSATHPSDGGFVFVQSTVPIYGIELFYNANVTILSNVAAGRLASGISYTPPATVAVPIGIQSLNLSSNSIASGGAATGTVVLTAAAPFGGALVTLSSGSTAASIPVTVTVPAGATSATFTVSAGSPQSSQGVTITASYNGTSSQATLTVTVAVANPVVPAGTIQITAMDKIAADPLDSLTITGSGFDPANAAISAVLISEATGQQMVIPAFAATTTSVQIVVPPFLNMSSGRFSAGTVDVQVIQVDGSVLSSSGVLKGLNINAPPAIPMGVNVGAITAAFLTTSQNVSSSIQSIATTNPSLSLLAGDLQTYNQDLGTLIAGIKAITSNPGQSVSIATTNGAAFTLDSAVLMLSDQLILAYVNQYIRQAGITVVPSIASPPAFQSLRASVSSTNCGLYSGEPSIDQLMCSMQQSAQNQATAGAKAVKLGAQVESGFYLGFLGGWAIDGLAVAEVISANVAEASQLAWSAASSYIASFATATEPPSRSDVLTHTLTEVVDKIALGGLGILPAALDSTIVYKDASKILASSAGQAPEGGLLLPASQSNAPQGTTVIDSFQATNSVQLAVPTTQQVKSVAAATIATQPISSPPAACTFQQQTTWDNMCLAQYNTNSVCNTGTLLQQLACVNAALGAYNQCLDSCTPSDSFSDLTKADLNFCPIVRAP